MAAGPAGKAACLMRQRYLVGTKLLETFARGLFVLVCTYGLSLEEAGRFGLLATLIGLLSFVLGYERQIDMQRQVAGRSSSVICQRMADTLRFFGAHYLLVLPLLVLGGTLWGSSPWLVALTIVVVVGEHFMNESYKAVLLDRRTFPLLLMAATKNCVQLMAVLTLFWPFDGAATALTILLVWAAASVAFLLCATIWWLYWTREQLPAQGDELPRQATVEQYRASTFHFLIGLVAVAALQMDRFVVGVTLSASDLGIYFRNIVLAGLVLQIFNIASFNRVAPSVYLQAREKAWRRCWKIVHIEFGRFALCLVGLVALMLLIDHLLGRPASRLGLHPLFIVIMTLGVVLRTAADFKGLLLLSLGGDQALFRNQVTAVFLGAVGLFALSLTFQLPGAFVGALLMPLLYFALNRFSVQRRFEQFGAESL